MGGDSSPMKEGSISMPPEHEGAEREGESVHREYPMPFRERMSLLYRKR